MRRLGRAVGKCRGCTKGFENEPAFTFAWEGWLMINGKVI